LFKRNSDVESLYKIVSELMLNTQLIEKMGKNASEKIKNKYDADIIANKRIMLYKGIKIL